MKKPIPNKTNNHPSWFFSTLINQTAYPNEASPSTIAIGSFMIFIQYQNMNEVLDIQI